MADAAHLRPLAQKARERERVLALPLEPEASVASERCSSHASNGPAIAPPCERCLRSAAAHSGSRTRDGAEDEVGVAGERLRRAVHRRRRRRGRAAAGRAAWPACCRPRGARRRRARRPPPRRCRRRRAPGSTASRPRRASRPCTRRRSPRCRSARSAPRRRAARAGRSPRRGRRDSRPAPPRARRPARAPAPAPRRAPPCRTRTGRSRRPRARRAPPRRPSRSGCRRARSRTAPRPFAAEVERRGEHRPGYERRALLGGRQAGVDRARRRAAPRLARRCRASASRRRREISSSSEIAARGWSIRKPRNARSGTTSPRTSSSAVTDAERGWPSMPDRSPSSSPGPRSASTISSPSAAADGDAHAAGADEQHAVGRAALLEDDGSRPGTSRARPCPRARRSRLASACGGTPRRSRPRG